MDEFLTRQLKLLKQIILDYRGELLSLNGLVQKIEAIGNIIGGSFWDEHLFEMVIDIERINSELIDKKRQITADEKNTVEDVLRRLEMILVDLSK
jgi:hypothetical protein